MAISIGNLKIDPCIFYAVTKKIFLQKRGSGKMVKNRVKQATQKAPHMEQIGILPNTSGKTLSQVQVKREPCDKG